MSKVLGDAGGPLPELCPDLPLLGRRGFGSGLLAGSLLATSGGLIRPASAQPAPATPKRGGSVRLAMASQSTNDTFDSAKCVFGNDYIRATSVYSYLTRLDQQTRPQPEIALSWEPNADATRWTFKIRQGVTFSDGSPLTLDDVVFSIMRHKEERVASSAKQLATNIKGVSADGKDGIAVDLNAPDVELPVLMSIFQFALVKNGTYDFTKPVGTGPMTVKEFQPGIRTVLARNPNYWKEGRPYVDQIEMFAITDSAARANALLSGDADIITELRGSAIAQVEASGQAGTFVTPSTRYTAIQYAVDRAPSSNHDLALAMNYLIDRKRVLDTVLRGYGSVANDDQIGPGNPLFDAALPQRNLDYDRAKFHVAKSGIGSTRIEVSVSDAVIYSADIGQLLQRDASRVGLNIDLKRESPDSYYNVIAGKRPFFMTNFHQRPTYNMLLNLCWKRGAVWNFSHYDNPDLDRLIDQAGATVDAGARKTVYDQIQSTIYDSGAICVPCFLSYVDGISKQVRGLTPVPIGNLGGFNIADTVWLDR